MQATFTIHLEDDDVSAGDIRAEVKGPDSAHNVHFNWVDRRGEGYFTPSETGLHKVSFLVIKHYGTVKPVYNSHSQKKIGFQAQLSLNAGQKYCRMLQGEHSAILLTFIKLPFVIKIFVLSIFEWLLKTGFTVYVLKF